MKTETKKLLSYDELAFFADQVSLMLSGGIPLYEAVEALGENYRGTAHSAAFEAIGKAMDEGAQLSDAMRDSGIFPAYAVRMTAIGEETGRLEQVLSGLSAHYARESRLKEAVRNSVRYPIALLSIMAIVVLLMNIKVMPLFERILMNLGGAEIGFARASISFGKVTGIVALILILIMLMVAFVLLALIKRGKKDFTIQIASKVWPPLARLERAISAERFLSVLSIALKAGYPPENAAEACLELIDDSKSKEYINGIIKKNEETGSLCDAICDSGFLEPLKERMVRIGFKTGRQDEVTANVAAIYSSETDEKLDRLLACVEPALITVLAVIIGCILLAVMLPLAGLMSSML